MESKEKILQGFHAALDEMYIASGEMSTLEIDAWSMPIRLNVVALRALYKFSNFQPVDAFSILAGIIQDIEDGDLK